MVNARVAALSETYSNLEHRIDELREYEDIISKNLESVNRTDLLIQAIDGKIKGFQKTLEKSDRKMDKVTKNLNEIEENTLILQTRKNEIQDLKDKFDEIDGISDVMEKRISQIQAMFRKTETLRQEIDETDDRLQVMYSETDRKMKEFADFIQAVDKNNPIIKQVKSDAPGKNINENIIKTVRDLSDKGWEAADISKKLLIDENSVRFIINTMSI